MYTIEKNLNGVYLKSRVFRSLRALHFLRAIRLYNIYTGLPIYNIYPYNIYIYISVFRSES